MPSQLEDPDPIEFDPDHDQSGSHLRILMILNIWAILLI